MVVLRLQSSLRLYLTLAEVLDLVTNKDVRDIFLLRKALMPNLWYSIQRLYDNKTREKMIVEKQVLWSLTKFV